MRVKTNIILVAAVVAATLTACNSGSTSSSISTQTATTPQPMPNSTWVNTNLSTYLSANGLTSTKAYYAATTDGLYLSTKKTSDNTEHVLFYSSTNQKWNDVTSDLGITLASFATELPIRTNGNGLIYIHNSSASKLYTLATNSSTWSQVTLPDSYRIYQVSLEAQSRKVAILGYKSISNVPNSKVFQLEQDGSVIALGDAEVVPAGTAFFLFSVSPNGAKYSVHYYSSNLDEYQFSINGNLYPEHIPAAGYTISEISNAGYLYFYPTETNPANNDSIYECFNGSCKIISSTIPLLNVTEPVFVRSFSVSSKMPGTFFMNVETFPTATTIANANYICNNITCTMQGNQQSSSKDNAEFTASSYTLYDNNLYSTTPSSSAFGYASGFYWLYNGAWSNLAPSLNDGQETIDTVSDQIYQVCPYTPTTALVRYLSDDGVSEVVYTNTSDNTWQNISQTTTQSNTFMDYVRIYTAVNPDNGASTFGGMIDLEKSVSDGSLMNISIYPQNIVCPALY